MPKEIEIGCSLPTYEIKKNSTENISKEPAEMEERRMVTVTEKAPDFTTTAYYNGKFVEVKLSDYLGKWVLLCFYPGDFTFV